MYYYYFADMDSLRLNVKEALENIYLILNGEWDLDDEEETEKMLEMFENPDEILAEVMSIKEIDISSRSIVSLLNLTNEEKKTGILEEPEEWVADIKDELENASVLGGLITMGIYGSDRGGGFFNPYEEKKERFEKIRVLARFVLKMAVYRFCKMHFPKLLKKSGGEIQLHIAPLENRMEEWEKQFWTVWVSHAVEVDFFKGEDLCGKRRDLRFQYTRRKLVQGSREERDIWEDCIVKAFKDIDTVENVKEMRQNCRGNKFDLENKNSKNIAEIESMRKMLDMMEKQINGELTTEEACELKRHASEWSKDMKSLAEMISKL